MAWAEDWTVNGKDYHNVTVGKVEPDRVHITYDGGIGTVMLSDLTPELQKRFNYDPAQAKAAAQRRDADQSVAAQSYASVDRLRSQIQSQNQAVQQNADAMAALYTKWDEDISHLTGNPKIVLQNKLAELKGAIVGCQSSIQQKQKLVEAVRTHSVFIGMPRDFLFLSLGMPSTTNTDTNANGSKEQFVYGSQYVYVENGVVTAVQTTTAPSYQSAPVVNSIQSVGGG